MTHIEIHCGIVQSATIIDANGEKDDPSCIGQLRFFVDIVEPEGTNGIWDGATYAESKQCANELSIDFMVPVHDNVIRRVS